MTLGQGGSIVDASKYTGMKSIYIQKVLIPDRLAKDLRYEAPQRNIFLEDVYFGGSGGRIGMGELRSSI